VKAICICLPENPDQVEKARAHFASRGLEVEFFWGIHGQASGLTTSHVYEVDHPGSGYKIGPNTIGNWLAHYMLWSCLMRLPDDRFLVLEADAQLPEDFGPRFDKALADAPKNFDFLHIGSCCVKGHPFKKIPGNGNVVETKHALCTHAYVIARKCLPLVLRTMRKVWAPIDIQLMLEVYPHLHTYAVMPRIVEQLNTLLPQ